MNILIADDSKLIHSRLQRMIGSLSFIKHIAAAYDMEEAIQMNESKGPDVVITDLCMPGSGFKFIEHLSNKKDGPTVIVLTNHATNAYRERCAHAGADYFLDKSLEFDSIAGVLHELAVQ